jgi:NAD(P)-dependent dehydrogenase (short-subunit alcohol dehydrogenase family)
VRAETGPFQAYAATKRELAESVARLAREYAPQTRVNGVAPGPVLAPEGVREAAGEIPLGRRPTPEDVARAVAFLAESESVTGQILFVDGGQHLRLG